MDTSAASSRAYASLPRRLQALVVDMAVLSLWLVAVLMMIPILPEPSGPVVWLATVLLYLLYEPVLVARLGGTVGHHALNLRVQREAAPGRIGFGRALLRSWIKGLLGVVSFVSMLLTRRHQAVHDSLSRSVVVVHDMARARSHHYLEERPESVDARLTVTRLRRSVAIIIYSGVIFLLAGAATMPFISADCYELDLCTEADDLAFGAAGLAMMVGICFAIVAGWKGKLPGARNKADRGDPDRR